MSIYSENMYLQYVKGPCQSRLCEADHASSYLAYAMTTASNLNGRRHDFSQASYTEWSKTHACGKWLVR
jgi:hypothetical protein